MKRDAWNLIDGKSIGIAIATAAMAMTTPVAAGTNVTVAAGLMGEENYQFQNDLSSGDVQVGHSGTETFATKPATSDLYASSSLHDAQLKARSSLTFGTGADFVPGAYGGYTAGSQASFSDTFYIQSTSGLPYLWSDTSNANFSFDVSGSTNWSGNLNGDPGGYTNIYTMLTFEAIGLSGSSYNRKQWLLGPSVLSDALDASFQSNGGYETVDLGTTSSVSYQFNPQDDFVWFLSLSPWITFDAAEQNASASVDFSHTVTASYQGPLGSRTLSDSGLFPNTLALNSAGAVPEPSTWAMMIIGFGLIGGTMRRRAGRAVALA